MVHASERERPDVVVKRKIWVEFAKQQDASRLVFLDESGINIDMSRRYGRSIGKERVVDHVPLNTPKTTTIISSVRLDGTTVPTVFSGSITGERFKKYLKDYLCPTLCSGDIVVMDNLASHKVAGVVELIAATGATVKYLPPYSPDMNPIELLWSKVKACLRKLNIRIADQLASAVFSAFATVCVADCVGWFSAAGYCS